MLYTLRGECARDLEGTLRAGREIGFEGVELFDLLGRDAHGPCVRCSTSSGSRSAARHTVLDAIENDLDELADELRELGTDRLVLAWIPPPASSAEADGGGGADRRGRSRGSRAAGLRLGFHNHDGELRPLDDGRTVLDRLLELPPERLFLEVDLGWAWFAGVEPADLVAAGRAARAARARQGHRRRRRAALRALSATATSATRSVLPAIRGLGVEWLLVEQDETEGPRSTRCAARSRP